MSDKKTKKKLDEAFKQNKEELQKGLNMAVSYGIEAYSLDKENGKIKSITLEEALELKDNFNYEVVITQDCSPEEVMKQFSEYLSHDLTPSSDK